MEENIRSRSPRKHWFITGATGFIGREFVRTLLSEDDQDSQISVLVRSGDKITARERLFSALRPILDAEKIDRILVFTGDVSAPLFGLSPQSWKTISRCTHLVHLAANTSFSASIDEARHNNLTGTCHMTKLAAECRRNGTLIHWSHVSTAYVVGERTDLIHPGDLRYGKNFRNCYEQAKNESEQFLKPFLNTFPLTIFRPSIVVGHSQTGEAGNFNTVYWAIRSYLKGQTKIYARPNTPLDLVPVDYVVDAMLALIDQPRAQGMTLHLAGGTRTTVSLLEFGHQVSAHFDSPLPEIQSPARLKILCGIASIARLSTRHRKFIEQAQSYLPYFCKNPYFDTRLTESLLEGTGINVPKLNEYLPNILNYCLKQPWGRRSKLPGTGYSPRKVANG